MCHPFVGCDKIVSVRNTINIQVLNKFDYSQMSINKLSQSNLYFGKTSLFSMEKLPVSAINRPMRLSSLTFGIASIRLSMLHNLAHFTDIAYNGNEKKTYKYLVDYMIWKRRNYFHCLPLKNHYNVITVKNVWRNMVVAFDI